MKILYSVISLISGLFVLDFMLSFFGVSPFNQGLGLFNQNSRWYVILIVALIVFGLSTALLFKKKLSISSGKRKYIVLIALGIVLVLGALPAGFMLEVTANGCCGAPSTGYGGIGYVLGGIMVVSGVAAIIYGIMKSRQAITGKHSR